VQSGHRRGSHISQYFDAIVVIHAMQDGTEQIDGLVVLGGGDRRAGDSFMICEVTILIFVAKKIFG
jgi:hypothetical protein